MRRWNNRKYGDKLGSSHVGEFLRKLFAVLSRALKNFASPLQSSESVNNFGFKGRQIISLPGAPNYQPSRGAHMSQFGPALMETSHLCE
jgi:hypothetical protein